MSAAGVSTVGNDAYRRTRRTMLCERILLYTVVAIGLDLVLNRHRSTILTAAVRSNRRRVLKVTSLLDAS